MRMLFTRKTIIQALVAFALIYLVLSLVNPTTYQPWRIPPLTDKAARTFADHAVNNTVVVIPVNTGMLTIMDNLLCSLRKAKYDASNLVFWALDENAEKVLASQGKATYFDPTLYGSRVHENTNGDTSAFRRMMKERPKFYLAALAAGFDLLMLDADTVFFSSPEVIIPTPGSDVDAVFSTDGREFYQDKNAFKDKDRRGDIMPPVCNGVFWMKSSKQSIALWREMLDVFESPSWSAWIRRNTYFQDDQRGMDVILNDGRARLVEPYPGGVTSGIVPKPKDASFKVRLLDQTQVVNGHLIVNRRPSYDENLQKLRQETPSRDRLAVHFNWYTKVMTKEEGARSLGLWYLNKDGSCKI